MVKLLSDNILLAKYSRIIVLGMSMDIVMGPLPRIVNTA